MIEECFYDYSPPHARDGFKTDPAPSLPILFFFAGPTCLCGSCCKFESITHFVFQSDRLTVNVLHFLLHAINGLEGGCRENNTNSILKCN